MTGARDEASNAASRSARVRTGVKRVTRPFYVAVLLGLVAATPVLARQTPERVTRGVSEWSASAAAARGITFLQSTGGDEYGLVQLAWGRVLTDVRGVGWLRGRFQWSVEVVPVFRQWAGGRAVGLGVAPLAWRWNLAPRGRVLPFVDVGGGALWTSAPLPAGTTSSNFSAHAGVGVRVLGRGDAGAVVSYRLHHISNGNRLRQNPGVNAHMLTAGWTWVRRP